MATLDINKSTTTNIAGTLRDFSVSPVALDYAGSNQDETYWDFPDATKNFGYYFGIPELKKAIDGLAIWVVGKGYETDPTTKVELDHVIGWGEDSFQDILWNMQVVKKVVGDAFAEIITDEKSKKLINLKPISPERVRIVVGPNGLIKRYDIRNSDGTFTQMKTKDILHLCNDRIADQIHGTSVIDACQWVIDARNEVLRDHRIVLHRNVIPVRIIEVDTDDTSKRDKLIAEYQDAIQKGEVLVLPKGTVEIKDNQINIQDPIAWIQYLENFFYIAVGIPRVMATSEGMTEAGAKIGYLTFEPVYTREQVGLEKDIWNQMIKKIKFNRPASLGGTVQQDEAKNTGQVGFQPKEAGVNLERE